MALVAGQDVVAGEDGVFRIARRVAADRVISTVDPEARHGRKSQNRRFDGYKAHVSCDPDGEFIDDIVITPANTHDADLAVVDGLLADHADADDKPTVMGDSAYASPDTIDHLEHDGFEVITVPAATNGQGMFTKDDFGVDVERERVVCPAGCIVPIRFSADGSGRAEFGFRCAGCPKQEQCTTAVSGRTITVHRREDILQRKKREQARSEWRRLPRRPAEGGTQDRPLHAGHVGRPRSPHPRARTCPDRRRVPRRCHQPGPPGDSPRCLHRRSLDNSNGMTATPGKNRS